MKILIHDYNRADKLCARSAAREWKEVQAALSAMPLYLKPSDQRERMGQPIFDPVGTNAAVSKALGAKDWEKLSIKAAYRPALGLDADFAKGGVVLEVQFSNYPFLANNVFRLELFHRMSKPVLGMDAVDLGIVLTKGGMFPASNSTLYYEQAEKVLDLMKTQDMFTVPIRLVGLVVEPGSTVPVMMSEAGARYSRTRTHVSSTCSIVPGTSGLRCSVTLNPVPKRG